MAEQVRKKGFGRHSSFEITDEVLEEIQRLSSQGMNQGQIYKYFGVSEATWTRKRKKCPELLVAYNKGKSHGVDKASKVLMELIELRHFPATKFYLETVGEFTTAPNFEENGEDSEKKPKSALSITVTDPIEAAKIYQEIMRGTKS